MIRLMRIFGCLEGDMKAFVAHFVIGLFLLPMMIGSAAAAPIWADLTEAVSSPVIGSAAQIRINNVKVQYIDPVSGDMVTLSLDAMFEWHPEAYVLVPVAIAGLQTSQLRVHVGSSVTGEPIVNAVASVGEHQVQTDEDGIARFFGLPDTPLMVRVGAAGYVDECIQVQISPGSWKRIAVGLMNEAEQ
jgi:hypothetical protein